MYVCIYVYTFVCIHVYMYRYKSTFSPEEKCDDFFFSHTRLFSSRRGKKKRMRADRENRFFFLNPINELELINQLNRTKTR